MNGLRPERQRVCFVFRKGHYYVLDKKKILTAGKCWRRTIPDNLNSHVIYNIPACQEVLSGITAGLEMEQDNLSSSREKETTTS